MNYIRFFSESGEADNCKEGFPCGLTCISRNKNCLNGLSQTAKENIEKFVGLLVKNEGTVQNRNKTLLEKKLSDTVLSEKQIKAIEKLAALYNDGKISEEVMTEAMRVFTDLIIKPKAEKTGAKTISYESLAKIKERAEELIPYYKNSFNETGEFDPTRKGGVGEFVDKQRTLTVPDEVVDIVFDMIPPQVNLNRAGDPFSRKQKLGWDGYDENGNPKFSKKATDTRGKMILKRYMEQRGVDPYTGLVESLKDMEPEHTVPIDAVGSIADHERNIVMASCAVNRFKDKMTAEELAKAATEALENNTKEGWEEKNRKRKENLARKGGLKTEAEEFYGTIKGIENEKMRLDLIDKMSEQPNGAKILKYALRSTPLGKSTYRQNRPYDSVGTRGTELETKLNFPINALILKAYAKLDGEEAKIFTEKLRKIMEKRGFSPEERAEVEKKYKKGSKEIEEIINEKNKTFLEEFKKLCVEHDIPMGIEKDKEVHPQKGNEKTPSKDEIKDKLFDLLVSDIEMPDEERKFLHKVLKGEKILYTALPLLSKYGLL